MKKYADTPASFAKACLVSIAASSPLIWTTDRHSEIYRLPGVKRIPLLAPERGKDRIGAICHYRTQIAEENGVMEY